MSPMDVLKVLLSEEKNKYDSLQASIIKAEEEVKRLNRIAKDNALDVAKLEKAINILEAGGMK